MHFPNKEPILVWYGESMVPYSTLIHICRCINNKVFFFYLFSHQILAYFMLKYSIIGFGISVDQHISIVLFSFTFFVFFFFNCISYAMVMISTTSVNSIKNTENHNRIYICWTSEISLQFIICFIYKCFPFS